MIGQTENNSNYSSLHESQLNQMYSAVEKKKSLVDYLFLSDEKDSSNPLHSAGGKKDSLTDYLTLSGDNRYSFYKLNENNPIELMNAINFFHGPVSAGSDGYFTFGNDGQGQRIPINAIPRINADTLPSLHATNNRLCLTSNSYYAYKGIDGKNYVCAFNGTTIQRAFTEAVLGNDGENVTTECRVDTQRTMWVLTDLVRGTVGGQILERETVKAQLASVGIKPGKFTIAIDGEEKTYYLGENGRIYTEESALREVEMYNNNNWLNNRSVGDMIMVFGREYPIGEDGHIHVPTEDFWLNEKCNYGVYK